MPQAMWQDHQQNPSTCPDGPSSTLALDGKAMTLGARWLDPPPHGLYVMPFVSGNTTTGQDSHFEAMDMTCLHRYFHEHGLLSPCGLPSSFFKKTQSTLEVQCIDLGLLAPRCRLYLD